MSVRQLFPTQVYSAQLPPSQARSLNSRLLRESLQLREDDLAGRRWSKRNYPGGFTSYGSAHRLHQVSPTFAALKERIDRHVARFSIALAWDLQGRQLEMTDCWTNIMGSSSSHGSHLHPLSSISGTYYVKVPRGSPGLKFEDPRLARMMAAPPRLPAAQRELRPWIVFPAAAGGLLLFESWLRHEVPSHPLAAERVSVSFNYNWF